MPNITKPLNMTEKYKIQKHSFTRLPWHEWEIDFSWENDVIWHLDPPSPPSKKNAPVPKFFDPLPPSLPPPRSPQQSSDFLLPPLTGNGCFCIFYTWLLATSTCSYF